MPARMIRVGKNWGATMQSWYNEMTGKQRMLVWVISAGLIFFYGTGLILCAILLYLHFGGERR
jgi:hypothetical protein